VRYIKTFLVAIFLMGSISVPLWGKKQAYITFQPISKLAVAVNFDMVSVLDLRVNKSKIGKTSDIFTWVDVTTKDSLSSELKKFVRDMTDLDIPKRNEKLLIVVKNIEYKDMVSFATPVSTIYLNIDCYLGNEQGYELVLNVDSLYEFAAVKGNEGFKIFNENLNYLLTLMVNNVAASKVQLSQLQSLEQIISSNGKRKFPVYIDAPHRGIYYSLKQFLDNSPADTSFIYDPECFRGVRVNCKEKFYLPKEKGSEKNGINLAEKCFAIYNDENKKWYRPINTSTFMPMSFENGDFYFYEIQKGLFIKDYSGMRVGLAGTITSAILEGQQRRKPPEFKDALYKIRFNPFTGKGVRVERVDQTKKAP
jgi:hypothetical protein